MFQASRLGKPCERRPRPSGISRGKGKQRQHEKSESTRMPARKSGLYSGDRQCVRRCVRTWSELHTGTVLLLCTAKLAEGDFRRCATCKETRSAFEMCEPDEGKLSSPVLRGAQEAFGECLLCLLGHMAANQPTRKTNRAAAT